MASERSSDAQHFKHIPIPPELEKSFQDDMAQDELLEALAKLEHDQWVEWSKAVAPEVSVERRARWEQYWVPYEQLTEEVKEHDRVWARKTLALLEKL